MRMPWTTVNARWDQHTEHSATFLLKSDMWRASKGHTTEPSRWGTCEQLQWRGGRAARHWMPLLVNPPPLSHNLCNDVTRPPTRKIKPLFLITLLSWSAASNRTSRQLFTTLVYTKLGGREVFKTMRARRSCTKMATNLNICTHGNNPPPTITVQDCESHTSTLCSSSQSLQWCDPPAHPEDKTTLFDNAAELKRRFQSHLLAQQLTQVLTSRTSHPTPVRARKIVTTQF